MKARLPGLGIARWPSVKIGKRMGLLALTLIILVVAIFFYYHHRANKIITQFGSDAVSQAETKYQTSNNNKLAQHDVLGYEDSELSYASSYMSANDYGSASRVLAEVQKNVPADKLEPVFYLYEAEVAKHDGNTALYKTYLQQLITKLRQANRTQEADAYAKQLSEVK